MANSKKKLFLIDCFALIYRAYFAFGNRPLINSDGKNISAIYGFFNSLFATLDREKPDYIAVITESIKPTFRHEMYEAYKATREKMPDDLRDQLPDIFDLLEYADIPVIKEEGYEADDVIGTIANDLKNSEYETYIYSGDKDLAQLVNENTFLYDPKSQSVMKEAEVFEKFGVKPNQIADYLALMGDSSDNVPGVPKIGKKTAVTLLNEFNSISELYDRLEEVTKKAVKKSLEENRELADLSLKLVEIAKDIKLDYKPEELLPHQPNLEKVIEKCNQLHMTKLKNSFINFFQNYTDSAESEFEVEDIFKNFTAGTITDLKDFKKSWKSFTSDLDKLAIYPLFSEKDYQKQLPGKELLAVGLSNGNENLMLDFRKKQNSDQLELFSLETNTQNHDFCNFFLTELLKVKQDVIIYDTKEFYKYLLGHKFEKERLFYDIELLDFLLNSGKHNHDLAKLTSVYLGQTLEPEKDVFGSGRSRIAFKDADSEILGSFLAKRAYLVLNIYYGIRDIILKPENRNLFNLYKELEQPLSYQLAKAENQGISLNTTELQSLTERITKELEKLSTQIFNYNDGEKFNIDSPAQLSELLFEKLGFEHGKKGKSGKYSTDVKTLLKLKSGDDLIGSQLAELILDYREKSKIKNTYLNGLAQALWPDNKIRTTYQQAIAATGRLSSTEPNLQSIPVKTQTGALVRSLFVPSPGKVLIAADYSQIELRIMAHYSRDENLLKAFLSDQDIHASTASILFNKDINEITREERAKAKVANFSVLYGKSKFGLSEDLQISFEEAGHFIDEYFAKFSGIKKYIDEISEFVKENGYTETLYGRRRYIPEIRSDKKNVVNAALRAAVNMPIQGSAADIIKFAMLKSEGIIKKFEAKLMLQVHDELVLEIAEENYDDFAVELRKSMENCVSLEVPLKVNINKGENWMEAH